MKASEKLKVLFVTHTFGMGGANHSLFQMMCEMKNTYQIEPTLLVSKGVHPYPISEKCKEYGIECIVARYYWFKGRRKSVKNILQLLLNFLIFYPFVIWRLRKRDFDIIHSNGSVIDIGMYINIVKKCKHVWHLREFGEKDFGVISMLGEKYEKWVYGKGDAFIAISKCVKEEYEKTIPAEKIHLIYNGVLPPSPALGMAHVNSTLNFVLVGVIQPAKNQLEAVKALKIVLESGRKAYLNFVGTENAEYVKIVKRYVSDNGLTEYVTFWGGKKNVSELLNKMDVGLMLSQNEAFGRVTVEYMMHNLAVIASNTGANKEIIVDNKCGLIYKIGNYEQLAEKMILLIDDREKTEALAQMGKKRAMQEFVSSKNSNEVYTLYTKLLK